MALKLIYITNDVQVARIAQKAGVDRIMVDMEYVGKDIRQKGLDSVKNHHTVEDVKKMSKALKKAEVIARVNPIHDESIDGYTSKQEIDAVIKAGADILMLPYFKTVKEVEEFIQYVRKRAKIMLLVESKAAVENIDEILKVEGIDEVFIGLNDLSLDYGYKFMFEPLANGMVESLCLKFKLAGLPYGFGGIASLNRGMLPANYIIKEHYKFQSTSVILSRSFCNIHNTNDLKLIKSLFTTGIKQIRDFEKECKMRSDFFDVDEVILKEKVKEIVESMEK